MTPRRAPSRRCAAPGALLPLRLDLERAIDRRDDLVGDRFAIEDLPVLPRMAMYPLVQLSLDPSGTRTWRRWLDTVEGPSWFSISPAATFATASGWRTFHTGRSRSSLQRSRRSGLQRADGPRIGLWRRRMVRSSRRTIATTALGYQTTHATTGSAIPLRSRESPRHGGTRRDSLTPAASWSGGASP